MAKLKITIDDNLAEQFEKAAGKQPVEAFLSAFLTKHAALAASKRRSIVLQGEHIDAIQEALGDISVGSAEDVVDRVRARCRLLLSGVDTKLPEGWLKRVEDYATRNKQDPKVAVEKAVKNIVQHLYGYF